MLSGVPTRAVRVVHEAVPMEHFRSPVIGAALKLVGRGLSDTVLRWVLEAIKRELEQRVDQFAGNFGQAAEADADGVTIVIVFRRPAFLAPLRRLLSGASPADAVALGTSILRQAMSDYALSIHPGFVRT
jgi:hypothetical protein